MMWKLNYRIARYCTIVKRDTLSPIFDRTQFFNFLTIPIFLLLSAMAGDIMQEVTSLGKTFLAMVMTFPLWIGINLILGLFKIIKEEREEGEWNGRKFVYHSPKHIHTFLITPDRDKENVRIMIANIPANSFVQFKIEYDGGLASLQIKNHEKSQFGFVNTPENLRKITYGIRLNNKSETVVEFSCPQNSSETVARVMAIYFEMGQKALQKTA